MTTKLESRLTLVFSSIGHSFSHLFILLYATVVLVLEREFAMSYAELQWLSVPAFVMFGVAALPAGWLGDRWSASRMMAVFFLGLGVASIVTGLADGPIGILVGLTLIGIFASIYHPVGIAWLIKSSSQRGRALGVNGVFGSLGTASAALVAGLLADHIGWRAAFIVPGIVALLVGAAFVACLALGIIRDHETEARPAEPASAGDMRRAFTVLMFTTICVGLIFQSTSVALPKLFDARLFPDGGSATATGALVSLVYLVTAGAQVVGGELADRLPLKAVYLSAQIIQIPVLLTAYFLHDYWLVVAAAAMVSLNSGGAPAENALIARYAPVAWRSRVFGIKFVISLGISSLGVALVPLVFQATGALDMLFFVFMGFAAVAAIGASQLPGSRRTGSAAAEPRPAPAGAAE